MDMLVQCVKHPDYEVCITREGLFIWIFWYISIKLKLCVYIRPVMADMSCNHGKPSNEKLHIGA